MKRAICMLAMAALAAMGAGCDSDFAPGWRIAKLRILALRADRPFAAPGERVSLQVLVVDPEARPLQWALATCTNPAGSSVDDCLAALDGPPEVTAPAGDTFEIVVPDDALSRLPDDARASALLGVVLVACPGAIERGTTQGVPIACRDDGGERLPITEFEVGFKRIFVRAEDRNDNPSIDRITWDGRAWREDEVQSARACGGAGFDLDECPRDRRHRIAIEAGAVQSGVDEHGTPYSEQLVVQGYATGGAFREGVRTADAAEHVWGALGAEKGESIQLFFVVRDDRGGVAWTQRTVMVEGSP